MRHSLRDTTGAGKVACAQGRGGRFSRHRTDDFASQPSQQRYQPSRFAAGGTVIKRLPSGKRDVFCPCFQGHGRRPAALALSVQ
jgi:hypothetical protein